MPFWVNNRSVRASLIDQKGASILARGTYKFYCNLFIGANVGSVVDITESAASQLA
jgi:hypothetical protein